MQKIGVLLINLGTPLSFQPDDVYRYLLEFLTDERVIDTSWWIRQFLVRGLIVPRRYKSSAKSYEQIWMPEGSPLMVYGKRVQLLLQKALGDEFAVELAMRYQSPSIQSGLTSLLQQKIKRLLIFPLFPHYASATTGSILQKVMDALKKELYIPETSWINQFGTHPAYLEALSAIAKNYPLENYDYFLFSYHGLPQRQLLKQDPSGTCLQRKTCCKMDHPGKASCYAAQCYATTDALARLLGIPETKFCVTFQSRLGREAWLQPYTNEKVIQLARLNYKKILVFCPSFICDCLETLYEIKKEYGAEYQHAGGETLDLVAGLNDHPVWIKGLRSMILEHLGKAI